VLVAVAVGAGCAGAASPNGSSAARALRAAHFSGVVVIGRADGSISLDRAFGSGLTRDTLFDIGSVAKLFTATAVLRLAEAGKLSLDRSIADYLPHVPAYARRITIRELLLHTSGLPPNFSSDLAILSRAKATHRILSLRLGPAGRFVYSNAGYVLLASIVQQVGGMPFQRYVRLHLLSPARVTAIGWYGDKRFARMRRAGGFVHGINRGAAGSRLLSWSIIGAGGLLATAGDLFRFCSALQRGLILDRQHLSELDRGYLRLPTPGPPARVSFGGILAVTRKRNRVAAVGGGTDFGFTADVRRYLSAGVITVVLANSDRHPAGRAGFVVEHALGL
jgi:CubicO group peptidase (beta-lactamase class C family)